VLSCASFFPRLLAGCALSAVLAGCVSSGAGSNGQKIVRLRGNPFKTPDDRLGPNWEIHDEFNKTVYRIGEPIEVRFRITNGAAVSWGMDKLPPWGLCDLQIIRVGGESLPTAGFVGTPGRWYI
jgi:hypothetical protein